jgi:metal-responsive CopG/Arc/MetJ family transcriptional regulator
MSSSKIAISVPEDVLSAVDAAAKERGESRSGFISRVLRAALRARRDASITRRLNELFINEDVVAEQRRLTREMDAAGTDWSDEVW